MDTERFARLRHRLKAGRVIRWWEWRGCSARQIAALGERHGVRLPATYRAYLAAMGKGAGRLFRHDHLAVTLEDVLDMTERVRARMAAEGAAEPFPSDGLVILGRLDAYFQLIRCGNEDDSPVWELDEGAWRMYPEPVHASVLDWLEFWCGEAEGAIRAGYFNWLPGGTRP